MESLKTVKDKSYIVLLAVMALIMMACQPVGSGSYRGGMPREYHTAYIQSYGQCYDSVPHNVVALDLYSDHLSLDESTGVMTGTGYNLYLSDIFIAGNTLEPGTYRSSTSAEPFTFLPGRDYEGTPHGLYLLYVEEDKLQSINVLDSGTMVVRDTTNNLLDLQFTLYFRNSYGGRATYKTHFQGELKPKQ